MGDHGGEQGERLAAFLEEAVGDSLIQAVLSHPTRRESLEKVKIRPVMLKEGLRYQAEEFAGNQAFHRNMGREEARRYIRERLEQDFRQCEVRAAHGSGRVLVGKKGTMTVRWRRTPLPGRDIASQAAPAQSAPSYPAPPTPPRAAPPRIMPVPYGDGGLVGDVGPIGDGGLPASLFHNRKKRYLLEEGKPVPFLEDLGVMNRQGQVIRSRYDKFRQINRFLEFIEDVLPHLDKNRENAIIDFGCGKSYLTFAMYHYLRELKGYPVRIVGLDLKKDVIARCSRLAEKYGYGNLRFLHGDIGSYEEGGPVDMVVTLHACDTATDHALAKAVRWGAKVILSVPCCQHELNRQIHNEVMEPVFRYGLLRERMAALYTDAIRAQALEHYGYRTQVLEFIDMEHTPKNILIRAVRQGGRKANGTDILELADFLHAKPTILELLPIRR